MSRNGFVILGAVDILAVAAPGPVPAAAIAPGGRSRGPAVGLRAAAAPAMAER
jgi:hypothetical protein